MSREIRQLDQAGQEFWEKVGYFLGMAIFWIVGFIFKLIGKILVSFYRLAKNLIIQLRAKIKKSR